MKVTCYPDKSILLAKLRELVALEEKAIREIELKLETLGKSVIQLTATETQTNALRREVEVHKMAANDLSLQIACLESTEHEPVLEFEL